MDSSPADLSTAPGSVLKNGRHHDENLRGEEDPESRSWIGAQAGPTETVRADDAGPGETGEEPKPEEHSEEAPGGGRRGGRGEEEGEEEQQVGQDGDDEDEGDAEVKQPERRVQTACGRTCRWRQQEVFRFTLNIKQEVIKI